MMIKILLEQLYSLLDKAQPKCDGPWCSFSTEQAIQADFSLYNQLTPLVNEPFYFLHTPASTKNDGLLGIGEGIRINAENRTDWISSTHQFLTHLDKHHISLPLFCLMGFDGHEKQQWQDMPFGFYWLPNILIRQHAHSISASLILNTDNSASFTSLRTVWLKKIERLIRQYSKFNNTENTEKDISVPYSAGVTPPLPQWKESIDKALALMADKVLKKVVLAREEISQYPHNQSSFNTFSHSTQLFKQWHEAEPKATAFFVQWKPGKQFFGCTPETLFGKQGNSLHTEALAGTTIRSDDKQRDNWLGLKLLHDNKNRMENRADERYINYQLQPLTQGPILNHGIVLKKLACVQHICRPISARLRPETRTVDIVNAMHPTPAVAGFPLKLAQNFIRKEEAFPRGWYTGTLGIIEGNDALFSVALRCAKQAENKLHLYAGAGIMPNSNAENEYNELDKKTEMVRSILCRHGNKNVETHECVINEDMTAWLESKNTGQ